jgi:methylenetetrahydrofolate dehydrogenase (NADP+)/methenyltetrahydrofolate cyclohydrolase
LTRKILIMIIDGRTIAQDILMRVKEQVALLPEVPTVHAIVIDPQPATKSYLRIKGQQAVDAGMTLTVEELPLSVTANDVITAILQSSAQAIILQLPLPPHIDTTLVLDAIPTEKDADVLSSNARALFIHNEKQALLPPVVFAVRRILYDANVVIEGKSAVVIGSGWLVGNPVAAWLRNQGAEVTNITRESGDFSLLKTADIIVSGAGSPHLVTPNMITSGVVLIDAGTSDSNGSLMGDIDPACAELASVFTPVPGGVGPIAVACLFENVLLLANKHTTP